MSIPAPSTERGCGIRRAGDADAGDLDATPFDSGTPTFGCGLPPPPYLGGETTCAGCPASNPPPATFVLNLGAVTNETFSGTVTSTEAGQWFVIGANGGETFGTIRAAARSDLILLDANPLENIANTARIAGVMVGGRWIRKAEIDRRLGGLRPR